MLSHKVSLYVPSTQNVGKPLPAGKHEELVSEVKRQFGTAFGGATAVAAEGGYPASNGDWIEEHITIVYSFHNLETVDALAIVIPIAQTIKYRYGQESIAIETEQGIDFI